VQKNSACTVSFSFILAMRGEGRQLGTDILRCDKISELQDGALPPTTSWAGGEILYVGDTANFLGVRRRLGSGHY
jgi:hypothetical protein